MHRNLFALIGRLMTASVTMDCPISERTRRDLYEVLYRARGEILAAIEREGVERVAERGAVPLEQMLRWRRRGWLAQGGVFEPVPSRRAS